MQAFLQQIAINFLLALILRVANGLLQFFKRKTCVGNGFCDQFYEQSMVKQLV